MARGSGSAWRRKRVVWGHRIRGRNESQDDVEIPQVSVGRKDANKSSHRVSQAVRLRLIPPSLDYRSSWRHMVHVVHVP